MYPFWGYDLDMVPALMFVLAFELACCVARFGFQLASTKNTGLIGRLTGGIRIHHGYVGLVMILLRNYIPEGWQRLMVVVGWGCVLSDGVHHFMVLWPATGQHDFDLVYPGSRFRVLEVIEARLRYSPFFLVAGVATTSSLLTLFLVLPRYVLK